MRLLNREEMREQGAKMSVREKLRQYHMYRIKNEYPQISDSKLFNLAQKAMFEEMVDEDSIPRFR